MSQKEKMKKWLAANRIASWCSSGIRMTCDRLGCSNAPEVIYMFASDKPGKFSLSCVEHSGEISRLLGELSPHVVEAEWRGMCPPIGGAR